MMGEAPSADKPLSVRILFVVIMMTVIFGVIAVVGLAMVATPSAKIGVKITGALVLFSSSWLAWRAWNLKAEVVDSALVIHGWLRTSKFALSEVDRVYVGKGRTQFQQTETLHVVLSSGEDRAFQAVSTAPGWPGRGSIQVFAEQVCALLARPT